MNLLLATVALACPRDDLPKSITCYREIHKAELRCDIDSLRRLRRSSGFLLLTDSSPRPPQKQSAQSGGGRTHTALLRCCRPLGGQRRCVRSPRRLEPLAPITTCGAQPEMHDRPRARWRRPAPAAAVGAEAGEVDGGRHRADAAEAQLPRGGGRDEVDHPRPDRHPVHALAGAAAGEVPAPERAPRPRGEVVDGVARHALAKHLHGGKKCRCLALAMREVLPGHYHVELHGAAEVELGHHRIVAAGRGLAGGLRRRRHRAEQLSQSGAELRHRPHQVPRDLPRRPRRRVQSRHAAGTDGRHIPQ
eukprot:gene11400-biopygen12839